MTGPHDKVASLMKEGMEHFRAGRQAHARACWEVVLELEPDNLRVQKYMQLLDDAPALGTSPQTQRSRTGTRPLESKSGIERPGAPPSNTYPPFPAAPAPPSQPGTVRAPTPPVGTVWPPLQPSPKAPTPPKVRASSPPSVPPELEKEALIDAGIWKTTGELELPLELQLPSSSSAYTAVSSDLLIAEDQEQDNQIQQPEESLPHVPYSSSPSESYRAFNQRKSEPSVEYFSSTEEAQSFENQVSPPLFALEHGLAPSAEHPAPPNKPAHSSVELVAPVENTSGSSTRLDQSRKDAIVAAALSRLPAEKSEHRSLRKTSTLPALPPKPQITPEMLASLAQTKQEKAGENLALALDRALEQEFGSQQSLSGANTASVQLDMSLPIIEYVRSFLLKLLTVQDNEDEMSKWVEALVQRDMEPLMEHVPLPSEILDILHHFFEPLYRQALGLYVGSHFVASYRLFLLCLCARPDDKRISSNLDKLKKRLEIK